MIPPPKNPTARIVGRTRELAAIHSAIDEARTGIPRILAIGGPPGIGKTTLAEQASRLAERSRGEVCWVRCPDLAPMSPLWVWERLLEQIDSPKTDGCSSAVAAYREIELSRSNSAVAARLRFAAFDLSCRCLLDVCRKSFIVLVIDNLQWADRASLQLLEFVCQQARRVSLLIFSTYRNFGLPEDHAVYLTISELGRETGYEQLVLEGLSRSETQQLVADRAAVDPTEEQIESLHALTEGNPLYLVEIAKDWQSGAGAGDPCPDDALIRCHPTLKRTITSRVYRLGPEIVRTLGVAAHIGRLFPTEVLRQVLGENPSVLAERLQSAQSAGLIGSDHIPEVMRFSHALVRDALRSAADDEESGRLHQMIASALELHFGGEADSHARELAHQFDLAARHEGAGSDGDNSYSRKCFRYSVVAGNQALRAGDAAAAAECFSMAISGHNTSEDPRMLAHVYWRLGTAECSMGRLSSVDWISRGFDVFWDIGDFEQALRCVTSLTFPMLYLRTEPAAMLERVLERVAPDLPTAALARCQIAAAGHHRDGNLAAYRRVLVLRFLKTFTFPWPAYRSCAIETRPGAG